MGFDPIPSHFRDVFPLRQLNCFRAPREYLVLFTFYISYILFWTILISVVKLLSDVRIELTSPVRKDRCFAIKLTRLFPSPGLEPESPQ